MFWNVTGEGTATNLTGIKPANALAGTDGTEIVAAGRKISTSLLAKLRAGGVTEVEVANSDFDAAIFASDVVDLTTGELLYEANQEATADKLH